MLQAYKFRLWAKWKFFMLRFMAFAAIPAIYFLFRRESEGMSRQPRYIPVVASGAYELRCCCGYLHPEVGVCFSAAKDSRLQNMFLLISFLDWGDIYRNTRSRIWCFHALRRRVSSRKSLIYIRLFWRRFRCRTHSRISCATYRETHTAPALLGFIRKLITASHI